MPPKHYVCKPDSSFRCPVGLALLLFTDVIIADFIYVNWRRNSYELRSAKSTIGEETRVNFALQILTLLSIPVSLPRFSLRDVDTCLEHFKHRALFYSTF